LAPKKKFKFKNKLFSLDATVIELCCTMFDWAKFRTTKGAIKLHALLDHDGYFPVFAHISDGKKADVKVAWDLELPSGSIVAMDRGYNDYRLFAQWTKEGVFFVTRLKDNACYREIQSQSVPRMGNVLSDTLIELSWSSGKETKTQIYRKVVVWLEDKKESLVLLTNQMHLAASTIGAIYKDRWQIELFFKCIKQNLKIKTFVGTSFNAVSIQIWTALLSLMLLKLVQWQSRFQGHFSNLIALVRWNLFTYRHLWEWLKSPFQDPFNDQRMFHQSFNFGQHPT
jgi:IS4 transposase